MYVLASHTHRQPTKSLENMLATFTTAGSTQRSPTAHPRQKVCARAGKDLDLTRKVHVSPVYGPGPAELGEQRGGRAEERQCCVVRG
jgi:hypothetical protein